MPSQAEFIGLAQKKAREAFDSGGGGPWLLGINQRGQRVWLDPANGKVPDGMSIREVLQRLIEEGQAREFEWYGLITWRDADEVLGEGAVLMVEGPGTNHVYHAPAIGEAALGPWQRASYYEEQMA